MRRQTNVERANDVIHWTNLGRPVCERLPVLSHRDRRMCSVRDCYTLAMHEHAEMGFCLHHWGEIGRVVSKINNP